MSYLGEMQAGLRVCWRKSTIDSLASLGWKLFPLRQGAGAGARALTLQVPVSSTAGLRGRLLSKGTGKPQSWAISGLGHLTHICPSYGSCRGLYPDSIWYQGVKSLEIRTFHP